MASEHQPKTPAWPPKSAPRLFVEQELSGGAELAITGNQAHYLTRVMRTAPGDAVILCDNITGEWVAKVVNASKRDVSLAVIERSRPREEVPDFWLCPALLKKDRFDLVLEKATELGVARIQPIIMRRCVADKLNLDRARMIMTEAAEQCARTALPEISEPIKLAALLNEWPSDRPLFFADEDGGEHAAERFANHRASAALLIGPEGGFDDTERISIREMKLATPISLGPRILRGETAAIAGTALWMGIMGDWKY